MMYASVRGVDGSLVSLGAIDLTAPGGEERLAALAQAAQGQQAVSPEATESPWGPGVTPQVPVPRAPPRVMVAPAPCRFRVPVRTQTGLVWGYRTMPCPPGVPAGTYVRVVQRGR